MVKFEIKYVSVVKRMLCCIKTKFYGKLNVKGKTFLNLFFFFYVK